MISRPRWLPRWQPGELAYISMAPELHRDPVKLVMRPSNPALARRELARALSGAARAKDLSTEDADQLAWFIRAFADYMRTRDGEEVFPALHRLTG